MRQWPKGRRGQPLLPVKIGKIQGDRVSASAKIKRGAALAYSYVNKSVTKERIA